MAAAEVSSKIEVFLAPSTAPDARKAADEWLRQWRSSPGADSTIDEVLAAGSRAAEEVQVMAAQAARHRARKRLPDSAAAVARRPQLLRLLIAASGRGPVARELAAAICELLNHAGAQSRTMLQAMCAGLIAQSAGDALLELLSAAGEEAVAQAWEEEEETAADRRRRRVLPLAHAAEGCAAAALDALQRLLQSAGSAEQRRRVGICAAHWLRFAQDMPPRQLAESQLIQTFAAAAADADPQGGMEMRAAGCAVVDSLARLLAEAARRAGGSLQGDWEVLGGVALAALSHIASLLQYAIVHAAPETVAQLAGGLGAAAGRMAFARALQPQIVEAMAAVTGYPGRNVADHVLAFWSDLAAALRRDGAVHEVAHQRDFLNPLAPLPDCIINIATVPQEAEDWDADAEQDWQAWRRDALRKGASAVCDLIGPAAALRSVLMHLEAIRALGSVDWREAEAVVTFVRHAPLPAKECDQVLPVLFSQTTELPQHWRVRAAIAALSGQHAVWIRDSVCAKALLPAVLRHVASCCADARTAPAAVGAIQQLVRCCGDLLVELFPDLLAVLESSHWLPLSDQEVLAEGLATLVCRLPDKHGPHAVEILCAPAMAATGAAAWCSQAVMAACDAAGVAAVLRRLAAVLRGAATGCDALRAHQRRQDAVAGWWCSALDAQWGALQSAGVLPRIPLPAHPGALDSSVLGESGVAEQLSELLKALASLPQHAVRSAAPSAATAAAVCFAAAPQKNDCVLAALGALLLAAPLGPEMAMTWPAVDAVCAVGEQKVREDGVGPASQLVAHMMDLSSAVCQRVPVECLPCNSMLQLSIAAIAQPAVLRQARCSAFRFARSFVTHARTAAGNPCGAAMLQLHGPGGEPCFATALAAACFATCVERDMDREAGQLLALLRTSLPGSALIQGMQQAAAQLPQGCCSVLPQLCAALAEPEPSARRLADLLEDARCASSGGRGL
eukprot:TRINITY_DN37854_c0_g1_i1.p1 TRINITY_DN37854_c0_g1~~TRINITY_DN37854_c0_g1_i1.p1  ORF type:complete len:961 (+),score=177.59 TRINITY_DN37854_c0_g1_i1:77-2959(+)